MPEDRTLHSILYFVQPWWLTNFIYWFHTAVTGSNPGRCVGVCFFVTRYENVTSYFFIQFAIPGAPKQLHFSKKSLKLKCSVDFNGTRKASVEHVTRRSEIHSWDLEISYIVIYI
jgi:hypothetical protein